MKKTFGDNPTHPKRALQAWQILIGTAMNRQTITYERLSVLMFGKKAPGVLDETLGHIVAYCMKNKLPILTAIVVGKNRGTPGSALRIDPRDDIDATREKVYTFKPDWYNIYPPSDVDLKAAFEGNDFEQLRRR